MLWPIHIHMVILPKKKEKNKEQNEKRKEKNKTWKFHAHADASENKNCIYKHLTIMGKKKLHGKLHKKKKKNTSNSCTLIFLQSLSKFAIFIFLYGMYSMTITSHIYNLQVYYIETNVLFIQTQNMSNLAET